VISTRTGRTRLLLLNNLSPPRTLFTGPVVQ